MKQIKTLATAMLLTLAATASAQDSSQPESFNKVYVEYSPTYVKGADIDSKYTLNNLALGYSHNIKISDLPMHLEFGGKIGYQFGENKEDDYKENFNLFTVTVPTINLCFDIKLGDKVVVMPYGGYSLKINVLGKMKRDTGTNSNKYDLFDKDEMGQQNVWEQFVNSWQAGVDVHYSKYFIGVAYSGDLQKTVDTLESFYSVCAKVGLCF